MAAGPDEFELIRRLGATQRASRDDVVLGIGDDGAVLVPQRHAQLVAVCDTLVAGRHFPHDTDAFAVGWKALAVNLSDLAAMGAMPQWALLALTLPAADVAWVERFGAGFAALAKMSDVQLVGGDTTRGPLAVTVTALGSVATDHALRRAGARVDDVVCVCGVLGEAALGLHAVQRGQRDAALFAHCIARLERPEPQLALGITLIGLASAAIDVSDGLLADLGHVARASAVAIELDLEAIPRVSNDLAHALGRDVAFARDCALAGGDDYLLAFCVPPAALGEAATRVGELGLNLHRIGRVVAGDGVRVLARDGSEYIAPRAGFNHFGGDDA